MADNLRQKTEIKLTAEIYHQGAALFGIGNGLSQTVVLDQTFNDVDLVGRPITIGNFADQNAVGSLFFSVTNTYTPYFELGDSAFPDPTQDKIITGTPYQEVLTNLPFGNQVLTGLFLDNTLTGPGKIAQTYQHTIFDKVGPAARAGLATPNISVDANSPPTISPFDLTTLVTEPSPTALFAEFRELQQIQSEAGRVPSQLQVGAGGTVLNPRAVALLHGLLVLEGVISALNYLTLSQVTTAHLAALDFVKAYEDRPRLITSATHLVSTGTSLALSHEMDVINDQIRSIAFPGQVNGATYTFTVARGLNNSAVEARVFGNGPGTASTATVFQAALQQGIPFISLSATNANLVQSLGLSADAKALIRKALDRQLMVIVPMRAPSINGVGVAAWYEIDPATGTTTGVLGDGSHGIIGNIATTLFALINISNATTAFVFVLGLAFAPILVPLTETFISISLPLESHLPDFEKEVKEAKSEIKILVAVEVFAIGIAIAAAGAPFGAAAFIAGALIGVAGEIDRQFGKDPSLTATLKGPESPLLANAPNDTGNRLSVAANTLGGAAVATLQDQMLDVTGHLFVSWASSASTFFSITALGSMSATVLDSAGSPIGTGRVSAMGASLLPLELSGNNVYAVAGDGGLSFYGPAESSLGVSGNWDNYSATVTGNVSIPLTTDGLTLNGQTLPAGAYTITTSSATLSGSGPSTSPNFSGSASITATSGTVNLGPGTGNVTVGGNALDPTNGATLTGYTGSLTVAAGGGNNLDNVILNGNAANLLQVSATPNTVATDQNTPIRFQANVNTSFADTYNLTAQAPPGWTVTIDSKGKVTATPAPGLQGGTYPIQIIAQSTTNPDLVAQTTVNVTITPTVPGLTLNVVPDPVFTVPFDGAQVPSAFRATIHNNGPTADTFHLTFPNLPSGFTLLNSGTSVTVPAGQTGIVGIYLQPSGSQLPPPGTQVTFTVTATSASDPSIAKSQDVTFTVPEIDAVTASANPTALNTTPGTPVSTTLTLQNAGNVSQSIAVETTTPAGLTTSDLGPVTLGAGQSTTESLSLTPAAGTPFNTTLTATVSYAAQPARDVVSVLQVTPRPAAVEAGQTVAVSATVFDGVGNPRQALASYTVTDANGTFFTSTPVPVQLTAIAATATVDLGNLSTAGLGAGAYTINVSLTEQDGTPIAGATGQGTLLVHSPVTASLTLDANTQAPGNATVTDTLTLTGNSLLGSLPTDGAADSIAVQGNLAYIAGTQDVAIIDLSNPASPQLVKTFGSGNLTQGGNNFVQLAGNNELLVASQDTSGNSAGFNLFVYSLADPRNPTLLSTTLVNYRFVQDLFVHGSTALVTTGGIFYNSDSNTITGQFGDLVSLDLSNPASPTVAGVLSGTPGPDGGASNQHGGVAVTDSLAYVLGSTSISDQPQTGSGILQVVNYANPTNLSVVNTLQIPGTVHAVAIAVQGNRALVVGSSGGYKNPFNGPSDIGLSGNVTLTMLDISDPANPRVLGSTLVTSARFPAGATVGEVTVTALGNGQFAVGDVEDQNGQPVLLTVDATDPANLGVSTVSVPSNVNGMTVSGDELVTVSAGGLQVYRISALTSQAVTARVQVPTGTGVTIVPNSFSLAPTQNITGANSETLVWNLHLAAAASQTITWQSSLSNLQADEVRPVTSTATVQAGADPAFTLPVLNVAVAPPIQTIQVPVQVVVPGADALANAAVTAGQVGNTALANRLNDLTTALTNLVQNPTSAIFKSQALANLDSVVSQASSDAFQSVFTPALTTARAALAAASTASDIQAAVVQLGGALTTLATVLADEAAHRFTLGLTTNSAVALPGSPATFDIALQNTGSASTTYDLSVSGLPADITAQLSQTSITLAPGNQIPNGNNRVTLSLTETGSQLTATGFTVTATPEGATELSLSTQGTLTLRPAFVAVTEVDPSPTFTAAGGQVQVSAKVLNAVNAVQQTQVSYTVTDRSGKKVFTSTPVPLTLTLQASLVTVNLGTLDTTGFANGSYTIAVTVADTSGKPLPGSTGQGTLLVGSPVTAALSVNPTLLPPGNGTITDTLTVQAQTSFPNPLTLDGQVATTPTSTTVALSGNLAYVAGTSGIDIVDISNPASPKVLSTFAQTEIVQGGLTVVRQDTIGGTNYLVVGTTATLNANQFTLLVYALANPLSPQLVSNTAIDYEFLKEMLVQGNSVLVPTGGVFYGSDGSIFAYFGTVLAVDVSNPAVPKLIGELFNNNGMPTGGDVFQSGGTLVNSQIAYTASSTVTGSNPLDAVGQVLVVDYSNPDEPEIGSRGTNSRDSLRFRRGNPGRSRARGGRHGRRDGCQCRHSGQPDVDGTRHHRSPEPSNRRHHAGHQRHIPPAKRRCHQAVRAAARQRPVRRQRGAGQRQPGATAGGPQRSQQHRGDHRPGAGAGQRDGRLRRPAVHHQFRRAGDLQDRHHREHSVHGVGRSAQQHRGGSGPWLV